MHLFDVAVPLLQMPGFWEWVIILLAILLLFGGAKLPQLGKGLGEGIRNFKRGLKDEDDKSEKSDLPVKADGKEKEEKGDKAQ